MAFESHIENILARHAELASLMADPATQSKQFTKYAQEYADMQAVVDIAQAYKEAISERADLEELLSDPDMKAVAEEEARSLDKKIPGLEAELQIALLPKDANDARNAVLEIRAGTGGDEAALFAADLLRMYKGYASTQGWSFEIMDIAENDIGGMKEVVVAIEGHGVFSKLKFESGAHRVQRVPETESGGRVHTSAATVAVLPEAEDVELEINPEDLRIDTYRASGSGGQHVNKTDSAVRITHIPTGVAVACQEGKSQHKNKAKAMTVLRSRLLKLKEEEERAKYAAQRKGQIGTGDRSERIRTYNFPQNRLTDHRIGLTLHSLPQVMEGEFEPLMNALLHEDMAIKLAALSESGTGAAASWGPSN